MPFFYREPSRFAMCPALVFYYQLFDGINKMQSTEKKKFILENLYIKLLIFTKILHLFSCKSNAWISMHLHLDFCHCDD